MSRRHSDPTANAAIGKLDRELTRMRKLADRLAALDRAGQLTPAQLAAARRAFTGIYKHLLDDALAR